jgi:predicted pyridoxine 5'-phosphate oxidase superfamily flavin-nucleotide-binding protein
MVPREPYHDGEIAVQERTGERVAAVRNGAIIRETLAVAAREFLALQRTVALAAVDELGRPWGSLWLGAPGFLQSADARSVRVSRHLHAPSPGDPVHPLLTGGSAIGMLAIDLASRRRLRINGLVAATGDEDLTISIREVFPNCGKYIQRRELTVEGRPCVAQPARSGDVLDDELRLFVEGVDTLFVASRHPVRGVDVSHRGGEPGFVRVIDERTLRLPDYTGNSMFQTLGNLTIDSRCGVVMIDFERGRLLSLTGAATITYGADDPRHPTGGTGRYLTLSVQEWLELSMPDGLGFRFVDRSPFNPPAFGSAR